ncbi:MAG: M16 family metallopeptidase [Puniceicoccaceae bacterium]
MRTDPAQTEDAALPVLNLERPGCGVASLQIWIGAGSRAEYPRHPGSGLAHFLEHMVFKGTDRRTAADINREAERLGGFLNAYTSYDRTVYHIDLPAESAAAGLDLLADFVWRPSLAREGFAPEREVILREMAMCRDDPDNHLFESVLAAAFHRDPLRFPVIGREERFRRLVPDDLRDFHGRFYRGRGSFLLAAGDLPAGFRERARSVVPAPPARVEPPAPPAAPAEDPEPVRLRLRGRWEGGRGLLLFLVPTPTPQEALLAEWVLETLAGGESAPLNRVLRIEEGLVHFLEGFSHPLGPVSLLGFSWLADASRLVRAEERLLAELDRLAARGVGAEAMRAGKDRLRFEKLRTEQSVEGWASRRGEEFLRFGRVLDEAGTFAALDGWGETDWKDFAARRLCPERAMTGALFPEGGS